MLAEPINPGLALFVKSKAKRDPRQMSLFWSSDLASKLANQQGYRGDLALDKCGNGFEEENP